MVAGLRSQTPLPLVGNALRQADGGERRPAPLAFLMRPAVTTGLALSAVGEMVGDKLPAVPNRLSPLPLGGRLVFGALAAAALALAANHPRGPAALAGGLGAGVGSVAGTRYRAALPALTGLPDLPWALVEDAAAVVLGLNAARGIERRAGPTA